MPPSGKKPTKSTAKTATTSEPTPTPPVSTTKTSKQSKTSKKEATSLPVPPPTPTPTPPPASVSEQNLETEEVNVVVSSDSTASVTANFSEFFTRFQRLLTDFSHLRTELKTLEKRTMKELRVVNKMNKKRQKRPVTRAPSGFVKPTKISDELANFLGKPFGSEMARTEVTREINAYIRANNLQDKTNGRKINPDTQLAKLLKVTDADELTYFNLQRFMSPHFAKKATPDAQLPSSA